MKIWRIFEELLRNDKILEDFEENQNL
jgi:hypothetical protein